MTRIALFALALALMSAPALASNIGFMKDAPLSKMKAEDVELLKGAIRQALADDADGEPQRWSNAKGAASGVVTPVNRFERDGMPCRRVEIANEAGGFSGRSTWDFCQGTDGVWRMHTPRQP